MYLLFYIPPNAPINEIRSNFDSVIDKIDNFRKQYPTSKLFLLGNFNKASTFSENLDIKKIIKGKTRKYSGLDHVYISRELPKIFIQKYSHL